MLEVAICDQLLNFTNIFINKEMLSILLSFSLFYSCVVAQDQVVVRVQAAGTSENVVTREQAIASAVANAREALTNTPCRNVELRAQSEARKVVDASATATARSEISISTRGQGVGSGASNVQSESSATAIAEAIAEAIALAVNGASSTGRTTLPLQVQQTARAVVQQAVISSGGADTVIQALATSTVFVRAVAEALSRAFADCETAITQVAAESREVPAPVDQSVANTNAVSNAFGPGSSVVVQSNLANAFAPLSVSTLLPSGTPALTPTPTPTIASLPTAFPTSTIGGLPMPGGMSTSADAFATTAQTLSNLMGQIGQ
eukprot:TRINITY_DN131_c0_g1_i3.p1 TRINITY_DN131_c0_g1~~TRINITY_DN131_c0_g1_i3.p1  ORF type:complete len:320 (-),score=71.96 TRINITY_DN131_c0_g1_i3:1043-2002(-)